MENKVQTKKTKIRMKRPKNTKKMVSVRISSTSKEKASSFLVEANSKNFGRTIKFDELFDIAINLITAEHLKTLQGQSMTNKDRKEILRKKYMDLNGYISEDDFIGFMMTPQFQDFLKQQDILHLAA